MAAFVPVLMTYPANGQEEWADTPGELAQMLWDGWVVTGSQPPPPLTIEQRLAALEAGGGGVGGPPADGSITPAKLSFDPATQVELDAAKLLIKDPANIANLPPGTTLIALKTGGTWPARPTTRADIIVGWKGADPSPSIVASGTGGMLDNVDFRLVTP